MYRRRVGGILGKGILVVAIAMVVLLSHGCSRDSDAGSAASAAADGSLFRNLGKR